MFLGEGQILPQWPSFFFSCLGVVVGQVEGFVEVRASATAFLLLRKWARPGCSVQHHGELGLVLTSHAAFVS